MIGIQFVDKEGDWPMRHWPDAPRVGDRVVLPVNEYSESYVVVRCTWEDGIEGREECSVTCYLDHLGNADELSDKEDWPEATEKRLRGLLKRAADDISDWMAQFSPDDEPSRKLLNEIRAEI